MTIQIKGAAYNSIMRTKLKAMIRASLNNKSINYNSPISIFMFIWMRPMLVKGQKKLNGFDFKLKISVASIALII